MKPSIPTRHHHYPAHRLAAVVLAAMACGFTGTLANAQSDDLFAAAKRGDSAVVNALLRSGADVNDRQRTELDQSGASTPLMVAAFYGRLEVVQALLAAKANVNAVNSEQRDGETALGRAVQKGHVEVVRALVAAKADVERCCGDGALYYAARAGNLEMVKALLTAKPDLNRRSKISGNTALMWGISEGRLDIARLLVEAGAIVSIANDKGVTALSLAVQGGPESLAMVQALLAAGAYVDSRNCSVPDDDNLHPFVSSYDRAKKATALGVASSLGRVEMVQALLAAKANPNLEQCDGKTPLTLALENNRSEVADLLISAGATRAVQ